MRHASRATSPWAPRARKNVFAGRIIEIEGLEDLTVEQAFELSDSTAERSAAGCTISLSVDSVASYLRSNLVMLRSLIDAGYEDARSLDRRAQAMERWLADPSLLRADADANYAAVIEIDASTITEPLVACPNDPDDVRPLSEVAGRRVDEVFIGSCMTNIGHFRAAGQVLASLPGARSPPDCGSPLRRGWTRRSCGRRATTAPSARRGPGRSCRAVRCAWGIRPGCRRGRRCSRPPRVTSPTGWAGTPTCSSGRRSWRPWSPRPDRLPSPEEYFRQLESIDTMRPDIYRYLEFDKTPAPLESDLPRPPARDPRPVPCPHVPPRVRLEDRAGFPARGGGQP